MWSQQLLGQSEINLCGKTKKNELWIDARPSAKQLKKTMFTSPSSGWMLLAVLLVAAAAVTVVLRLRRPIKACDSHHDEIAAADDEQQLEPDDVAPQQHDVMDQAEEEVVQEDTDVALTSERAARSSRRSPARPAQAGVRAGPAGSLRSKRRITPIPAPTQSIAPSRAAAVSRAITQLSTPNRGHEEEEEEEEGVAATAVNQQDEETEEVVGDDAADLIDGVVATADDDELDLLAIAEGAAEGMANMMDEVEMDQEPFTPMPPVASPGQKFTREEDELILALRRRGMPWAQVAERLPGRTRASVQGRFTSQLKPIASTGLTRAQYDAFEFLDEFVPRMTRPATSPARSQPSQRRRPRIGVVVVMDD